MSFLKVKKTITMWHSGMLLLLLLLLLSNSCSSSDASDSNRSQSYFCQKEDGESIKFLFRNENYTKSQSLNDSLSASQKRALLDCVNSTDNAISQTFADRLKTHFIGGPTVPIVNLSIEIGSDKNTYTCKVEQPNVPATFSWLLNGKIINDDENYKINTTGLSTTLTLSEGANFQGDHLDCQVETEDGVRATKTVSFDGGPHVVEPEEDGFDLTCGIAMDGGDVQQEGKWICRLKGKSDEVEQKLEVKLVEETKFVLEDFDSIVTALLGSDVKLDCSYNVNPELTAKVLWEKDGDELADTVTALNLEDVQVEDGGEYSCTVSNSMDSIKRSWTVIPSQAPKINPNQPPDSILVLEGSSRILNCSAEGIPPPEISWKFSDDVLEGANLVVDVEMGKNGSEAVCTATNEHGEDRRTVQILVARPTKVNTTDPIKANAGQTLVLPCIAQVDPLLHPSRSWFKIDAIGGREERLKDAGDVLEIKYLTKDHAGRYLCRVTTELDRVELIQDVDVIYTQPKITSITLNATTTSKQIGILQGDSSEIKCHAEGIPRPEVTWTKRNDEMSVANEVLVVEGSKMDEGRYACVAANEYGSDAEEVEIKVYEGMKILGGRQDIVATSMEDVLLDCGIAIDPRLAGDNLTSLSWSRDGIKLDAKSDSLMLQNVMKNGSQGRYVCTATNALESLARETRLTVLGEKPEFIATEGDARALEGSDVTLSCQANGLPMPKIQWSRLDKKTNKTRSIDPKDLRFSQKTLGDLVVKTVSAVEDEGEYICTAANVYGRISTATRLQVIRRAEGKDAKEVVKNVGDDAVLPCDVSVDSRLNDETKVSWRHNKEDKIENGRRTVKSDSSLEIRNLTLKDRGLWECRVETPFELVTARILLQVSGEAPRILSDLGKVTLYEGERLHLKCLVRGVPRPEVKWLREGAEVSSAMVTEVPTASAEFRQLDIVVTSVSKADEANFQCQAENVYGSGVAKFSKVSVISRTRVSIDANRDVISVNAGEKLKVPCGFQHDPANRVTGIRWSKDGGDVDGGTVDFGADGAITVRDVQRKHEGNYSCTVTTLMDNATDWVSVSVTVNAPVITKTVPSEELVNVFQGDDLDMECSANGIPEPEIIWLFNNTALPPSNKNDNKNKKSEIASISLTAVVAAADAGNYDCVAKNPYGETRRRIKLGIVGTPDIKSRYLVRPGDDVAIPGPTSDPRIAQSVWKKDNVIIKDNNTLQWAFVSESRLTLVNITDEARGVYSLTLQSDTGKVKVMRTVVDLKPDIFVANSSEVEVTSGSTLTLTCGIASGIELAKKRLWRHDGKILISSGGTKIKKNGEILEIEDVKQDQNGGTYSCAAVTDYGQDIVEFFVEVVSGDDETDAEVSDECEEARSYSPKIENLSLVSNDSVRIEWVIENASWPILKECFEGAVLTMWTNATESIFQEIPIDISDTFGQVEVSDLDSDVGHYVQINLKSALNLNVYGETRSFSLSDLGLASQELASKSGLSTTELALAITFGVLGIVFLILILMFCLCKRRSYQLIDVLCPCCHPSQTNVGNGGQFMGKKRNTRKKKKGPSLALGSVYQGNVLQVAPVSPDDFMRNLAPQWPEPDPEAGGDQMQESSPMDEIIAQHPPLETDAFLRPPNGALGHANRNSISSSWSSLFNVQQQQLQQHHDNSSSVRSSLLSNSNNNSHSSASNNGHRVSFAGVVSRGVRRE